MGSRRDGDAGVVHLVLGIVLGFALVVLVVLVMFLAVDVCCWLFLMCFC